MEKTLYQWSTALLLSISLTSLCFDLLFLLFKKYEILFSASLQSCPLTINLVKQFFNQLIYHGPKIILILKTCKSSTVLTVTGLVSLLSSISKINKSLESNSIIREEQFGCRSGWTTTIRIS